MALLLQDTERLCWMVSELSQGDGKKLLKGESTKFKMQRLGQEWAVALWAQQPHSARRWWTYLV